MQITDLMSASIKDLLFSEQITYPVSGNSYLSCLAPLARLAPLAPLARLSPLSSLSPFNTFITFVIGCAAGSLIHVPQPNRCIKVAAAAMHRRLYPAVCAHDVQQLSKGGKAPSNSALCIQRRSCFSLREQLHQLFNRTFVPRLYSFACQAIKRLTSSRRQRISSGTSDLPRLQSIPAQAA